ncbi:MAG: hypothetical protein A2010_10260 [Nitrospirae bacterium GWD2_57_9]|nr:MAG: hypothetical protein A2010_10260 [Nitrospirae bacterium GWD2_57_9]OGW48556.1 MAG: hypothetical protein A2078_08635 [Nitrospirae bacterium GWC2_57_9]
MAGDRKKTDSHDAEKERKPAESKAGAGHDDACRCKETSQMSPGQLLRVMINDLAFWKKPKKK